jgi:hypothetical protein
MPTYDKRVATELYRELAEIMKRLPSDIEAAPNEGPVINIICEGLEKAVLALKTEVR